MSEEVWKAEKLKESGKKPVPVVETSADIMMNKPDSEEIKKTAWKSKAKKSRK